MQECVVRNITNGIEEGLYRKEVNLSFMTRIYFQGVFSIKDIDVFPLEEFDNKSLQDLYLDYHLRAMVTEQGLKLLEKHINFKINS